MNTTPLSLRERPDLSNNDHLFAFLRSKGWRGGYESADNYVIYFDDQGEPIAGAVYDNTVNTYTVWEVL